MLGGTLQRWEKIADEMGRTVAEVTNKAKTIKYEIGVAVKNKIGDTLQQGASVKEFSPKSVDTEEENENNHQQASQEEDVWNQNQQKLLEMALKQFSKTTPERWDKIANCVPDKTKEECIARYKVLAEKILKAKKSKLKN